MLEKLEKTYSHGETIVYLKLQLYRYIVAFYCEAIAMETQKSRSVVIWDSCNQGNSKVNQNVNSVVCKCVFNCVCRLENVCVHARVYVYTHECVCSYVSIHVFIFVRVFVHVCEYAVSFKCLLSSMCECVLALSL